MIIAMVTGNINNMVKLQTASTGKVNEQHVLHIS